MTYLRSIFFLIAITTGFSLSANHKSSRVSEFYTDSTFTSIWDGQPDREFIWARVEVEIPVNAPFPFYLEIEDCDEVNVFFNGGLHAQTGRTVPLSKRSIPSHRNLVMIGTSGRYLLKLKAQSRLSSIMSRDQLAIISHEELTKQENNRLIGHGIFFGLIMVMCLYNLMIFFSVRDSSYLYYVLSILGIGLYLSFVYGFSIEYFWPEWSRWDYHFFAFIIPITNVCRILFTKSYLHTSSMLPSWDRFFNILIGVYVFPFLLWALSYFGIAPVLDLVNMVIGGLGTTVLVSITVVSVIAYRNGYQPALWFLLAYLLFNVGGVLFILRELQLLDDNFFTRYLIQYGVGAQVILFSLGLASRLNDMRKKLSEEVLEREVMKRNQEVEKKKIIESQKAELEKKVRARTAELEALLEKITSSEHELKELNEIKDKLLSIISHDLKSPLTTVDSFLNLLTNHRQKLTEEELDEVSNKTKYALQNLTLLLDNLLQWSRTQQDYIGFQPSVVSLKELIEKNQRLLKLLLEEKGIKLKLDIEEETSGVWVDRNMIDFVIRNVIHNAIKFSPKGSRVSIKVYSESGLTHLEITDEGRGMTEKEINQVLVYGESFTTTGTEKEKGSGIGLLLCKEFVERNGGSFGLRSKGQGLTASFTCPSVGELV